MKRRQLLLPLVLLPTITETLEDSVSQGVPALPSSSHGVPALPSSSVSLQSSQTLEDYMSSIQALARPTEAASYGPVRLQRTQRPRLFAKAQMKHSASASMPRGSPRTLRTSRLASSSMNTHEEFSLTGGRARDPVDWLFGQSQSTRT